MRDNAKFRGEVSPPTNDGGGAPGELRLVDARPPDLQLLIAWPNPLAVFAGNVSDFLHARVVPGLVTTSAPDHSFWRDIDLRTPFPRRGLVDSVLAHAALLGLLYAVSLWPKSSVHIADPLSRHALHGYTLSEYLPELHGAPVRKRGEPAGKHDPVLAKQEILSLPETPDNLRQTIITPPKLKLEHDIELPNLVANTVAYEPAAPLQPLAASARLRLPAFMPEVVRPAAETGALHSHSKIPAFAPQVVEPAPDVVGQANPRLALPSFQSKVVEPAPDVGKVGHGNSGGLARLSPTVVEPVSLPPHMGNAQNGYGQIIALSVHPAEVRGPQELPRGNRKGAFAASPDGHTTATGTPGAKDGSGAGESSGPVNAPAGISVAPAAAASAASMASPNAPTAKVGTANPNLGAKVAAAMRTPLVASVPPHQPIAREDAGPRSELENRIFAGRRSYTLSVNMPNLNTRTGSWIIHFVEHNAEHGAESGPERKSSSLASSIVAPVVVRKSDPAYPSELIHDRVQGTVILTAIIRADGSVGDIAVVKSLDPRLDQNASQALSQWHFRPALKDGRAIDLEAVITVPFRSKATPF